MIAPSVILFAVLVELLIVCVIFCLLARLSGWSQLARAFPLHDSPPDTQWRFLTIHMRFGGTYSGVVTVGADTRGLSFALLPFLDIGHRPFLVPWSEMRFQMKKNWWSGPHLLINFPRYPGVFIKLPGRLALQIGTVVGLRFTADDPSVATVTQPTPDQPPRDPRGDR